MELLELKDCLEADKANFDYTEEPDGLVIRNKRYGTKICCTPEAVAKYDWPTIKAYSVCGRDVNHITRVTGYFTIVEGWNKGKLAELDDRHHGEVA